MTAATYGIMTPPNHLIHVSDTIAQQLRDAGEGSEVDLIFGDEMLPDVTVTVDRIDDGPDAPIYISTDHPEIGEGEDLALVERFGGGRDLLGDYPDGKRVYHVDDVEVQ